MKVKKKKGARKRVKWILTGKLYTTSSCRFLPCCACVRDRDDGSKRTARSFDGRTRPYSSNIVEWRTTHIAACRLMLPSPLSVFACPNSSNVQSPVVIQLCVLIFFYSSFFSLCLFFHSPTIHSSLALLRFSYSGHYRSTSVFFFQFLSFSEIRLNVSLRSNIRPTPAVIPALRLWPKQKETVFFCWHWFRMRHIRHVLKI